MSRGYFIAFTTPRTEKPAENFTDKESFNIKNLPNGFDVVYCQEFEKKDLARRHVMYWTRQLRKEKQGTSNNPIQPLPKEIERFSEGRKFTRRDDFSWAYDDSIGNCFFDGTDEKDMLAWRREKKKRMEETHGSSFTGAVFSDVYFYMVHVGKESVDLCYLFRNKMQRLFNAYLKFLRTSEGLANAKCLVSDLLTDRNMLENATVYDCFCNYLGMEIKNGEGEKQSHFKELIKCICLPIYRGQTELEELIENEIKGTDYEDKEHLAILIALHLLSQGKLTTNKENKTRNMENSEKINEYIKMLKINRNVVLTGAPGTGKTTLAHQIAEAMEAVVDSVQFHPSYDYTDFVEGLRPTPSDEKGNIAFNRKNGVFMDFCESALKNIIESGKTEEEQSCDEKIETLYNDWIDKINNGEVTTLPLKSSNAAMDIIRVTDNNNVKLKAANSKSNAEYIVSLRGLQKLARVFKTKKDLDDIKNINKEIRKVNGGSYTSCYWAALHYLYTCMESSSPHVSSENNKVKRKNFVFIIDEINRGEISKIFGELFFSIDPGYRGTKGMVKTQYANLCVEPNEFDDYLKAQGKALQGFGHFFVPENVYVIGTMNDIDRSVETMDFAMRRRFVWKEVTAEESMEAMKEKISDESKKAMEGLNKEIAKADELGKAYKLGAAYFIDAMSSQERWQYKIEPLLLEYLRGTSNIEENMKKFKNAYFNSKDNAQPNTITDGQQL